MERAKKEVIIYTKKDINGKEIPTHIYMIDENLAKEYKSLVKKKEEYKNSWLIKNKLPKDLFDQVESRSLIKDNLSEQYDIEKNLQFQIHKYDNAPFLLKKALGTIKII